MNENFQIYDIKKKELLLNNFCKCLEVAFFQIQQELNNNLLIWGSLFSGNLFQIIQFNISSISKCLFSFLYLLEFSRELKLKFTPFIIF